MGWFFKRGKKDRTVRYYLQDTKSLYTNSQKMYIKKRYLFHMEIVRKSLAKAISAKAGTRPKAILIGGGTASGKTTLKDQVITKKVDKFEKYSVIDADIIKEAIPEYYLFQQVEKSKAAELVHKESHDIMRKMIKVFIKHNKYFIYEGTMARTSFYEELMTDLLKNNYYVEIYAVTIPLELAKKRAKERENKNGRKVPERIIEHTHQKMPLTLKLIKEHVHAYYLFDNRDKLKLIACKQIFHPLLYNEFLNQEQKKASVRVSVKARKE